MLISSSTQMLILIAAFFAGINIGILFDIYRVIRGFSNPNIFVTFVEDILFWILSSILIFIFLLFTNFAFLSVYTYFYIFMGLYLYFKIASNSAIKYFHRFFYILMIIFRVSKNYLIYPVYLILKHKNKN